MLPFNKLLLVVVEVVFDIVRFGAITRSISLTSRYISVLPKKALCPFREIFLREGMPTVYMILPETL